MSSDPVNIAPIACRFFDLMAFTADPNVSETIIRHDESLGLRVSVEFSRSGAIALMPLALSIQVDFFAKAHGSKDGLELGSSLLTTAPGVLIYHPTLKLAKATAANLVPKKLYKISALLQVGALNGPALINGYLKTLTIQTYNL